MLNFILRSAAVMSLVALAAWTVAPANVQTAALDNNYALEAVVGYQDPVPARRCKDVDVIQCGREGSFICPLTDCNRRTNQWVLLGMPCAHPTANPTDRHCTFHGEPISSCGKVNIYPLCRLSQVGD